MKEKKSQSSETPGLNVIQPQVSERTKWEIALGQSMGDLADTMRELVLVEKLTGRAGLPQRVCLAFSDALMCAMRFSGCENEK
ncbi:hypothetical protein D1159_17575 [Pseudoflavonifractor sp. 524-17]|uniref:hypothetical protein n=1 Tax=Pseudoflavonifractor sp. 524-17 TaxID=2304577 RepID=UPI00137A4A49|nr:hypothetical protein [Pseudoflavonifractor sp. 524-17]NCE66330.1 hypothetical protein [Pseudoflavonifractor sp. 524-17]